MERTSWCWTGKIRISMVSLTQENEGSEGANSDDDNESPQGRPSNLGVFPNIYWLDDELEQSSTLPFRVLVFTTIRLLGFLTMSKRGSVDRTFKLITPQLFIFMVEYRGVISQWHLAVYKSAVSYYVFLLLVLNTFNDNASAIFEIYWQTKLKLWQIKCDFEVDIHLGFEMLRLSGCFFHYTHR